MRQKRFVNICCMVSLTQWFFGKIIPMGYKKGAQSFTFNIFTLVSFIFVPFMGLFLRNTGFYIFKRLYNSFFYHKKEKKLKPKHGSQVSNINQQLLISRSNRVSGLCHVLTEEYQKIRVQDPSNQRIKRVNRKQKETRMEKGAKCQILL